MGAKKIIHKVYQAKKYIALHKRLVVNRNGEQTVEDIEFVGGGHSNNRKITGKFATKDPAIQEALEKNKGFNIEYKLIRTEDHGVVPEPEEDTQANDALATGDSNESEGDTKIAEEPKTVAEARQYLIDSYPEDVQVSKMRNKADVLKAAKELNVEFPNLPE